MTFNKISITRILSIPFEENTYLAYKQDRNDCIIVDPGLEPDKIIDYLDEKDLVPSAILNTHGHSDHIAGNQVLKKRWPECPLVIGAAEAPKLTNPQLNLSALFGFPLLSPQADITLNDNEQYTAGGMSITVREIPGHSSGHVVYLLTGCNPLVIFVGDVIFAGSIGRTDFPDGDQDQLIQGIRTKLFTLPPQTVLLPGHGPATTVGEEKRSNPFVRE